MSINAITVGTVRERERESYTLVTESVALFNSLTHTHTLCLLNNKRLVEKAKKQEKVNKIKIYKQEKKPIFKIGFSSCFFVF